MPCYSKMSLLEDFFEELLNKWNFRVGAPLTDRAFSAVVAAVSSKLCRGQETKGRDGVGEAETEARWALFGTRLGLDSLWSQTNNHAKKPTEARAVPWC